MEAETKSGRLDSVAAHPLAELLECPPATGNLLTGSAVCLNCDTGQTVFHQGEDCKGLYVVVAGQYTRSSERLKTRLMLGPARAGDLMELAAALGDGHHTYTLRAITPGALLLLPIAALHGAFESYPPLRMHLLEELAREVSRAYIACSLNRKTPVRRRTAGAESA
jgi:CRP-like cAMP-binding protein